MEDTSLAFAFTASVCAVSYPETRSITSAIAVTTLLRFLSSLWMISIPGWASLYCLSTHKPNPASEVVTVGTLNARLSRGVYPHGS